MTKEDNKCENCWEFNKCSEESKKQCAVHKNDMGKECWLISSLTFNNREEKRSYEKCFACDWFKRFNPVQK
ncbi:hypothetical protein ACFL08_04915 [Patescibacteria group bacterium]